MILEGRRRNTEEDYAVRYVAWIANLLVVPDTEADMMSIAGGPTQAP